MYKLSVTQYPSGKWGLVGSVPQELCTLTKNHLGQEYYKAPVFDTKEQALAAIAYLPC